MIRRQAKDRGTDLDKAEYKVRLEEINALAEEGKFAEAAAAADTVDWRHVKSVRTLSMIGEIYEANRQYEESRTILKLAYKRSATSKTVLYRLAELDIRTGYYDEAKKFINEFEQISPNDTSRYILKYKLLRARKAPYDDQIEVLRNFKDAEYSERWAFELARLYKRNGQNDKCIEECDDLILWFSEGKYVRKAIELKMSLTELSPSQKVLYESLLSQGEKVERNSAVPVDEPETMPDFQLNAIETVEKAVNEADDDDEENRTKSRSDIVMPEQVGLPEKEEEAGADEPETVPEPERSAAEADGQQTIYEEDDDLEEAAEERVEPLETFQTKFARGFRNVFSGMKKPSFKFGSRNKAEAGDNPDDSGNEAAADELPAEAIPETGRADADEIPMEKEGGFLADRLPDEILSEEEAADQSTGLSDEVPPAEEDAHFEGGSADETAAGNGAAGDAGENGAEIESSDGREPESGTEEKKEPTADSLNVGPDDGQWNDEAAEAENTAGDEKTEPEEELFDLEKLFAETAGAFAEEVASGNYVMADTLESEREAAEAEAAQRRKSEAEETEEELSVPASPDDEVPPLEDDSDSLLKSLEEVMNRAEGGTYSSLEDEEDRKEAPLTLPEEDKEDASAEEKTDPAEQLYARETDESLGLTREFHIRDEIEKLLAKRRKKADAGTSEHAPEEPKPVINPEEAARKNVAEANGTPYMPESEASEMSVSPDDEAAEAELLADEEDIPEIPAEDSSEELMNISSAEETYEEEEAELIENIVIQPDYLVKVPVEGRQFTSVEKNVMTYFAGIPGIDYQTTAAVADIHNNSGDKTSVSGNVLIMGRQGSGKTRLGDALIRISCMDLGLKAVKSAKIVADELNGKDPAAVVKRLAGGFLIIEAAGSMSEATIERLNQAMEFRTDSLVVILEDEKADLLKMLKEHPEFAEKFTSRITVPVFTNDELVSFGCVYANEEGYFLDEMATLALYTMIGENQKDSEPVTVGRVKAMIDRAIDRKKRKFRLSKSDRQGGRIVLHEKDFNF